MMSSNERLMWIANTEHLNKKLGFAKKEIESLKAAVGDSEAMKKELVQLKEKEKMFDGVVKRAFEAEEMCKELKAKMVSLKDAKDKSYCFEDDGKSETDRVTDEKAPAAPTKGVYATQGDKTTAAKGTTQVAPTQTFVGNQTTQGGATTAAGGRTKKTQETGMVTGIGKTARLTSGGTRQTGETQNPEEADIDFTQIPGTAATRGSGTGGTRPTQFPSDADADPTQNPTAFTGGGEEHEKTSKTQLGTTAGTNQTQA